MPSLNASVLQVLMSPLIWIVIIFLVYMGSILVHHLLDKTVKKYRLDNLLIYRLTTKTPLVSTRVIYESEDRPDLKMLQKSIEDHFLSRGFDENSILNRSSYQFKFKRHPTPFRIRITEGDIKNPFTITLETIGEDKLPYFTKNYFSKTISLFEEINNLINKKLQLRTITAEVMMSSFLGRGDNMTLITEGNEISTKKIVVGETSFTKIKPLIDNSIRVWRNNFI